jgi:ribosome-associated toxin RatA of RatAB toxin-antitoxin module
MEITRSALLLHPASTVFDLIERAENYPQFLPWCVAATILERRDDLVVAKLTVDYHGVRFDITTRNPARRPDWMAIHLERGPFSRFEGEWNLTELGAEACRAEFALRYQLGSTLVAKAAGRVFDGIANTLVDAFARRADQVSPPLSTVAAVPSAADPGEHDD